MPPPMLRRVVLVDFRSEVQRYRFFLVGRSDFVFFVSFSKGIYNDDIVFISHSLSSMFMNFDFGPRFF